jgi:2',3'-cyclic-nucleotide 2'-phosphodiesterase (5'-nucleotidase family)
MPAVILDSGNVFSEKPPTEAGLKPTLRKAHLILRAMERMGYQAAAVGEYDLYLGRDNLTELIRSTDISFLSANVKNAGGDPVFPPSIILSAGGTRVGVFGLTSRTVDVPLMETRVPGWWVDDPVRTAAKIVPDLAKRCDLVIALTHIGYPLDRQLAEEVEGIDVIIGGRTKNWLKSPQEVAGTLIVSGYFQGRAIGKLTLDLGPSHLGWASGKRIDYLKRETEDKKTKREELIQEMEGLMGMTRYDGDMITLTSSYPDDPEVTGMIREYRISLKEEVGGKGEGGAADTGRDRYIGYDICIDCHRGRTEYWGGTDHASAVESLKPRDADADPDCLPCHVTGYLRPTGYSPANPRQDLLGVQCEACHGRASLHAASPELYRLIRIPPASMCRTCHTPDQDDDFDYVRERAVVCAEQYP